MKNSNGKTFLFIVLALSVSLKGEALCLKDCEQAGGRSPGSLQVSRQENREQSHNMGNVKNSVLGDVRIRIGHERVNIGGLENATNNLIDTSIHSTIIMGDVTNK